MIVDYLTEIDLISTFESAARSPLWQEMLPHEFEDRTHFRDLYVLEKKQKKWACLGVPDDATDASVTVRGSLYVWNSRDYLSLSQAPSLALNALFLRSTCTLCVHARSSLAAPAVRPSRAFVPPPAFVDRSCQPAAAVARRLSCHAVLPHARVWLVWPILTVRTILTDTVGRHFHWPGQKHFIKTGQVVLVQQEYDFEQAVAAVQHLSVHSIECGMTEDGVPQSVIRRKGSTLEVRNQGDSVSYSQFVPVQAYTRVCPVTQKTYCRQGPDEEPRSDFEFEDEAHADVAFRQVRLSSVYLSAHPPPDPLGSIIGQNILRL
jgi:hypothetical protein